MKKIKMILPVLGLCLLSACHQAEEVSVPAESSAETSISASETVPETALPESNAPSETQASERSSETETVPAESDAVSEETAVTLPEETSISDTVPETEEETVITVPETIPEETAVLMPEISASETGTEKESEAETSGDKFSHTCWAGIDGNHAGQGLLFGEDTVKILQIDENGTLSGTEYQYSAGSDSLAFSQDGTVSFTRSWLISDDGTQLTLTDTSGTAVTFYAVDGSTEEEVIAVMDALALMQ